MKRLLSFLLVSLFVFTAALAGGNAFAAEVPDAGEENDVVQSGTQADDTVLSEEETTDAEEDPAQLAPEQEDIAETAVNQSTDAPTEAPTDPEETPYRDSSPVVERVSFSSGGNVNTLTLYTDSTANTAEQYENMKKYGNRYRWYYKSGKSWKYIGSSAKNSFVWYPPERGRSYTFTVRCADKSDKRFISDFSRTGYTLYYCRTPGNLKAKVTNGSIRFSFDRCYGAKKYAVYRKAATGWKRLGITQNNFFIDGGATAGASNTYTVRCVNDKGNVFWSNFKQAGVSIYLPDYSATVRQRRNKVNKLLDTIATDITKYPNGYYARPDIYLDDSSIPRGAQWCVAFPHYVLNKGLGGYYACQWGNIKPSPSCWNPYTTVWSRNAYYDGDIFYRPSQKEVPAKGDIIFFRHRGEADTFSNIGHCGVVLKINGDGSIDTLEGNIGTSAATSRVRIAHYTKSGGTWISNRRIISGFLDLSKVIEKGKKYNP